MIFPPSRNTLVIRATLKACDTSIRRVSSFVGWVPSYCWWSLVAAKLLLWTNTKWPARDITGLPSRSSACALWILSTGSSASSGLGLGGLSPSGLPRGFLQSCLPCVLEPPLILLLLCTASALGLPRGFLRSCLPCVLGSASTSRSRALRLGVADRELGPPPPPPRRRSSRCSVASF